MSPSLVGMKPIEDDTFAERLDAVVPAPDTLKGKLVIITVERDTMSHFGVLRNVLSRFEPHQWLAARIINASAEFFLHALNVETDMLSRLNTTLLEPFMQARTMKIQTDGGTDLRVTLDSDRYRWISNRGKWREGHFLILPSGEVATYPESINGVLVADGAFNVNAFTQIDARLRDHPVKFHIEDGHAVDFECADADVCRLIELCFSRPNGRRVGEIGFGTNFGVEQPISMNSHINERRPGVHLGFGQHNQSIRIMDYPSDIHLDMIAVGGRVWVDDNPVPVDLHKVKPSDNPHPEMVMDEDIDGDCCGLFHDLSGLAACAVPPAPLESMPITPQRT
jgi:leucyl aminopeptidase (aminopeptidase T)